MDYNDLVLFARVVEGGSFTAAAQLAGLPKSSVTRGIARLEQALGVRLIQRTTRQRGVTDAGRALYERVRAAIAVIGEAGEAVREAGQAPRGVVRVTAPTDAGLMGVPEAIAQLVAVHPGIHVEMLLTARMVDLVGEGVDLGIRAGRLADSSLVARRVGTSDLGLFAAKAYLARRGRPRRVADLARHDAVLFRGRGGRASWTLTGPRGEERADVAGAVSADDMSFALRAIAAGLGIGIVPLFLARRDPARAQLERVLPEHVQPGAPFHVVMPSAAFVPARVQLVRDFLVDHLARELAAT